MKRHYAKYSQARRLRCLAGGILLLCAGCGYQDFAKPPVRNYAGEWFASGERPEPSPATSVATPEQLAAAAAQWRKNSGAERDAYLIGVGDRLVIGVEIPSDDAAARTYEREVDGDGCIEMPLLGKVRVGSMTATQAAQALRGALEQGFLKTAWVNVEVKDYRSKQVHITGAVARPASICLHSNQTTLVEALLLAGGALDTADDTLVVVRAADVEAAGIAAGSRTHVSLRSLLERQDLTENVVLYPGDLVHVPPTIRKFGVLGYVNSPGYYDFPRVGGLRVLDAVAAARGLSWAGRAHKVTLLRTIYGIQTTYPLDLARIASGRDADIQMEPGDTIIVSTTLPARITEGLLRAVGLRSLLPAY